MLCYVLNPLVVVAGAVAFFADFRGVFFHSLTSIVYCFPHPTHSAFTMWKNCISASVPHEQRMFISFICATLRLGYGKAMLHCNSCKCSILHSRRTLTIHNTG